MRILLHDFGRFPFTLDMARWLAAQGHQVAYAWCADLEVPCAVPQPSPGVRLEPLSLGRPVPKYRPLPRWRYERGYAKRAAALISALRPQVVVSAHAPPLLLAALQQAAHRQGAGFLAWLGDLMSPLATHELPRRLPLGGRLAARLLEEREFAALAAADRVVAVSPAFVPPCLEHGVAADRIAVLSSWEPAMPPPSPGWAERHGLAGCRLVVYAGTLGLKHEPARLVALAEALALRHDVRLVVATQGVGRHRLELAKRDRGLRKLVLLDYQHGGDHAALLASAEVAVAVLEPFASPTCVPLKVWSYLAAGCPVVAAMPADNPAARAVVEAGAGAVVPPDDAAVFATAVARALDDADWRRRCGEAGLAHARAAFAIEQFGPRFEAQLRQAAQTA